MDDRKVEYYRKLLPAERKRFVALRAKMDKAQAERDVAKMAGLGLTAIDMLVRYQIMLDNLLSERINGTEKDADAV